MHRNRKKQGRIKNYNQLIEQHLNTYNNFPPQQRDPNASFVQIERQTLKSTKKSNFLRRVEQAEKPNAFGFEKTYQQKR